MNADLHCSLCFVIWVSCKSAWLGFFLFIASAELNFLSIKQVLLTSSSLMCSLHRNINSGDDPCVVFNRFCQIVWLPMNNKTGTSLWSSCIMLSCCLRNRWRAVSSANSSASSVDARRRVARLLCQWNRFYLTCQSANTNTNPICEWLFGRFWNEPSEKTRMRIVDKSNRTKRSRASCLVATLSYASLQLCNRATVFIFPFRSVIARQEEDGDVPMEIHVSSPAAVRWSVVF